MIVNWTVQRAGTCQKCKLMYNQEWKAEKAYSDRLARSCNPATWLGRITYFLMGIALCHSLCGLPLHYMSNMYRFYIPSSAGGLSFN